MSLDIVEYALDNMTDYVNFEKLASEIMRDEGYSQILPLGGMHDSGQDAMLEKYFSTNNSERVVFQYTMKNTYQAKYLRLLIN